MVSISNFGLASYEQIILKKQKEEDVKEEGNKEGVESTTATPLTPDSPEEPDTPETDTPQAAEQPVLTSWIDAFEAQGYPVNMSGNGSLPTLPGTATVSRNPNYEPDPARVKSEVIDDFINELAAEVTDGNEPLFSNDELQQIGQQLEAVADEYIESYSGHSLRSDLKKHLEVFLYKSDSEKMIYAEHNYDRKVEELGIYIDSNEFETLKAAADQFLQVALANRVEITLGGVKIESREDIAKALENFPDAASLKEAMDEVIAGLSDKSLIGALKEEKTEAAKQEQEEAFDNLKGSDLQVDPLLINYSNVSTDKVNYYTTEEFGGWEGKDEAREFLNNEGLKAELEAQIKQICSEKGIPYEKIEVLFDNIYNNTIEQTVENAVTLGMSGPAGMFSTEKRECVFYNTKDLVAKFIENFNTNMAAAFDEMQASDKDLDLQDIDRSEFEELYTKENFIDGMVQVIGTKEYVSEREAELQEKKDRAFENMKSQLEVKAKAMCAANGIEYDENVFNTIYENAKNEAIYGDYFETLDNLLNKFKADYTAWVNGEK